MEIWKDVEDENFGIWKIGKFESWTIEILKIESNEKLILWE